MSKARKGEKRFTRIDPLAGLSYQQLAQPLHEVGILQDSMLESAKWWDENNPRTLGLEKTAYLPITKDMPEQGKDVLVMLSEEESGEIIVCREGDIFVGLDNWHYDNVEVWAPLPQRLERQTASCPSCGKETTGYVFIDELGRHMVCKNCEGSFDV